jgi:hypothetical protein
MPEGDARLAWSNLGLIGARYAPVTKRNLIKTKKEFIESRLEGASLDSDMWILLFGEM